MTDTQIFAFLVMPFLFVLICSMVFFGSQTRKSDKAADPPKPVIRPNAYMRKPRKRSTSVRQTDAIED
jgi:Na+-transporting methylmalonyl-CoA/oxaloacetate decarboxylase gamma subunit